MQSVISLFSEVENDKSLAKLVYGVLFENCGGDWVWAGDSRFAVREFQYLRDRLFLLCCALYALNRWMVKPHLHNHFIRGQFNDILLIPCALPPLLLIQRSLRLRTTDHTPSWSEVGLYLLVWSILFEVIGPRIFPHSVGDPLDVLAYVVGGIFASLWWNRKNALPIPAAQ